jgi:hypothetical protein
MRLSKGQIIYTTVLLAVFAAFGAVYQFYFKLKLEQYAADERWLASMESTFAGLEQTFAGYKPEVLITAWRSEQQPWADSLESRIGYFSYGDWLDVEGRPAEGEMWKFWYEKQVNDRLWALYQKVGQTMGGYNFFPADIRQNLGIKSLEDWQTGDVTEKDVMSELQLLEMGVKACELLLDAKASSVTDVQIWPVRFEQRLGNNLRFRTVGFSFTMTPRDLVAFLEELRLSDRYFHVDGLRIVNTCIACPTEPHYTVDMLLSQARYFGPEPGDVAAGIAVAGGAPGGGAQAAFANMGNRQRQAAEPEPEPGFFGAAWKWFKYNILVMN